MQRKFSKNIKSRAALTVCSGGRTVPVPASLSHFLRQVNRRHLPSAKIRLPLAIFLSMPHPSRLRVRLHPCMDLDQIRVVLLAACLVMVAIKLFLARPACLDTDSPKVDLLLLVACLTMDKHPQPLRALLAVHFPLKVASKVAITLKAMATWQFQEVLEATALIRAPLAAGANNVGAIPVEVLAADTVHSNFSGDYNSTIQGRISIFSSFSHVVYQTRLETAFTSITAVLCLVWSECGCFNSRGKGKAVVC